VVRCVLAGVGVSNSRLEPGIVHNARVEVLARELAQDGLFQLVESKVLGIVQDWRHSNDELLGFDELPARGSFGHEAYAVLAGGSTLGCNDGGFQQDMLLQLGQSVVVNLGVLVSGTANRFPGVLRHLNVIAVIEDGQRGDV